MTRPAAGGGRWVTVAPERLERWLTGFADRHGSVTTGAYGDVVRLVAADGSLAEVEVPFPPLPDDVIPHAAGGAVPSPDHDETRTPAGAPLPSPDGSPLPPLARALVAHALAERRIGVLLVRLGGCACGVFTGPALVVSKVTTRPVHGRSAAGGQSQQRFARRREGQARVALDAAADTATRVLLPEASRLDAVVCGGERTAVDAVLADRRLAPLRPLVTGRLLDGPDPRQRVLEGSYAQLRQVWIRLVP